MPRVQRAHQVGPPTGPCPWIGCQMDGHGTLRTRHGCLCERNSIAESERQEQRPVVFLARLNNAQLQHTLFPIGHLEKEHVRGLARQFGLPSAEAPESQDACLVAPNESFSEMLRGRFGDKAMEGPVIDGEGRTLKFHAGIHQFTVGQRRGLGIAGKSRIWVKSIDVSRASVSVTSNPDELLSSGLVASDVRWFGRRPTKWPLECDIQVRYRQKAVRANLEPFQSDSVRVTFSRRIRAVAPGQGAVFFDGDRILGSGWIDAIV